MFECECWLLFLHLARFAPLARLGASRRAALRVEWRFALTPPPPLQPISSYGTPPTGPCALPFTKNSTLPNCGHPSGGQPTRSCVSRQRQTPCTSLTAPSRHPTPRRSKSAQRRTCATCGPPPAQAHSMLSSHLHPAPRASRALRSCGVCPISPRRPSLGLSRQTRRASSGRLAAPWRLLR